MLPDAREALCIKTHPAEQRRIRCFGLETEPRQVALLGLFFMTAARLHFRNWH